MSADSDTIVATHPAPDRGKIDSEKARRIVAAMHTSIGMRGTAGSTFDQVAAEAGVSRGLLHYYFGSKERLVVEVVRYDCDVRLAALDAGLERADSIEAIVDVLVEALEGLVERDPGNYALIFELFTAARNNEDLRREMAELYRRVRANVRDVLDAKRAEGVVDPIGTSEAVVSILFALGDGIALQMLSDPDWDSAETFRTGTALARHLLGSSKQGAMRALHVSDR